MRITESQLRKIVRTIINESPVDQNAVDSLANAIEDETEIDNSDLEKLSKADSTELKRSLEKSLRNPSHVQRALKAVDSHKKKLG